MKRLLILISCTIVYANGTGLLSLFSFMVSGFQFSQREDHNTGNQYSEFDFIIVGAGTAGCALANRLSENRLWTVLLIEAGSSEHLDMDIPLNVQSLQLDSDINWGYRAQSSNSSCLAMNDNRCKFPRGHVMGGSSVLNYMIYTRGNRRDYDRWAELGNTGWSFNEVLPYFKKLENNIVPNLARNYAGKGGPLTISEVKWKSQVAKAFVKGSQEMGIRYVDYNGPTQIGVSYLQTTTKNGLRVSSNVAYLHSIYGRPNLFIRKRSHVTKILISKKTKTAYGVKYLNDGRIITVRARKEVIISAGAINSPQLLMLSGIGPAHHLKDMNIELIVDLPVGKNLMDHTAPGGLTFTTNTATIFKKSISLHDFPEYVHGKGNGKMASTGGCESLVFLDLKDSTMNRDGWPDVELLQTVGSLHSAPEIKQIFGLKPQLYNQMFGNMEAKSENAFMIYPIVLRPKSRGHIMLKNSNPLEYPLIYPNYFSDPYGYDMKVSIAGIKKTIELVNTPAFKKINAKLHKSPIPACTHLGFGSDAYWECHTRYFTFTVYHYSGTCKMGPRNDPTTVVGPKLRVKGINRLRVVDASIFPEIMAGHPNAGVHMIAEKAADMIKEYHSEPKKRN